MMKETGKGETIMKKLKRFLTIGLSFLLTLCVSISFVGCLLKKYDTYNSEYFIYQVSRENGEAYIVGLTDFGKEQEYLVVPEFLDGRKVNCISEGQFDIYETQKTYGEPEDINYESEKLKKVFIVSNIAVVNAWLSSGLFSKKEVFYISNSEAKLKNYVYRTKLKGEIDSDVVTAANVSYYYNYENAPNDGYYWIDNYGYGEEIEYIPANPIRDGYTFGGWYKESECISIWDFETDSLPQGKYDENEVRIYQETKLYAKWIKE